MTNVMLISPDEVKAASQVNYNFDDSMLGAAIRTSQDVYLSEIITDALLERLKTLVYNAIQGNDDSIVDSGNEAYKTLLDDYVQPYLIWKTTSECCMVSSLKIRNMGVVQNSDTNVQGASLSDIKYLRNYYETEACTKATRLSKYIYDNKASFSEIKDCYRPKEYANTGLWLGKGRR